MISPLSDFGARDSSAGPIRGELAGIVPAACVIDITHPCSH
jgi:S-adenosylmethionine hydrolase